MKERELYDFNIRLKTSLLVVPLIFLSLLSQLSTFILVFLISVFVISETNLAIKQDNKNLRSMLYLFLILPIYFIVILEFRESVLSVLVIHSVSFISTIILVFFGIRQKKYETGDRAQFSYFPDMKFSLNLLRELTTIVFVTGISGLLFLYTSFSDIGWVLLPLITVVTVDTFSYIFGSIFGRNKFESLREISPNKSVEGFIFGYVFGAVVFFLVQFILDIDLELFWAIFLTLSMPLLAILGDLLGSGVKRNFGVKNFGYVLPGHGGFMDRLDSLVATFMLMLLVKEVIL